MDSLRIPVVEREIVLFFSDGSRKAGKSFVSASAPDHTGTMRIGEWLNSEEDYFPFLPDEEESPILVNKKKVLIVTAMHEPEQYFDEVDLSSTCRVRIEMERIGIEGTLVMDMPESRMRVLDVLNSDRRFLFMIRNGQEVHINKIPILRVIEIKEK
ncbi:MAG: hypothetical protein ACOCW1_00205 [Chitinispirillaceae bacterium]